MSTKQDNLYTGLKKIFHEPSRLAIMSVLSRSIDSASFVQLKDECELTDGNLSSHLKMLEDAGIELVYAEQWPEQGFSDWITLANSIKTSEADLLLILIASPDEGIELIRALQTVDYQPKGVAMSQGSQREFLDALGEAVNGITIHGSWHPLANFSGLLNGEEFTNEDFLAAFREKFGREGDEDEAIPFALCQGMEQAVRATGTTDNTAIRDWFAARTVNNPVKTILGDFYWDDRGLPVNKPFIMVQWQGEELEFVYPKGAFPGVVDLVWPKPEW